MHGSPSQVSSGNLTGEFRAPRFAQLDAQIKAEDAEGKRRPEVRRKSSDLSNEVDAFVEQLKAKYASHLSNRPQASNSVCSG